MAQLNPFRYRGYYYDAETGFYYLENRYYDPEIGRFINADTTDILGVSGDLYDKNLYAYCDNNPVMREDVSGEFWNIAAGAVIGAGLSVATQVFDNWISGTNLTDGVILAAAGGAITGGLAATGAGKWVQAAVSGLVGAGCDLVSQSRSKGINKIDWGQVAISGAFGALSGYIGDDGIRHKNGKVAKATKLYDDVIDGIKNRTRAADVATKKLTAASKKLITTWRTEISITTAKYFVGTVVSTTGKRSFIKSLRY
jgi:RHS repeat-associated protein